MADRIKGITIEIDGNATPLQKSLEGVQKSLKDTQSKLRDVNKLLKGDPSNINLLKQKQDLLNKAIQDTKEKLDKEKEALAQLKNADQTPEVKAQMEALERQISADEQSLKKLKDEAKDFGSVAKQAMQAAGDKVKEFGDKVSAVGDKVKGVGEDLTKNVTGPIVALGGASVAAFNEVDAGLDTIIQKTGATGESAEEMGEIMQNLATSIPTDFQTAGDAIGEVNTRFGLTGTDLQNLSGQFIKFAQLNNTDVSTSIDNVQKALAAYGLGAEDAGAYLNRLNKTGQDTGVNVDSLAQGIVSNATAFKEMGLNIDEATVFMGQLEKSGANSETVLNGMRKALKNATEQGIPLDQALSDLQDTILNGKDGMDGLTAAYDLFGKSGDQIFGAVKDGTVDFTNLKGSVESAAGSVNETFEGTLDPIDKWKTTMNELKGTLAEVGASLMETLEPVLVQVGQVIADLKAKWDELSPETQQAIIKAALIAAAIGPVLVVIGTLISSIGSIISLGGTLISSIGALASPVGLVIGVIALLVAAGVALYQNWDKIKEWAGNLKDSIIEAWNNIKTGVSNAITAVKDKVTAVWNAIKTTVTNVVNGIKNTITSVWEGIKSTVTNITEGMRSMISGKLDAIKAKYEANGGGLKGIASATMEGIKQYFTLGFDALNTITGGRLEGLKNKVKNIFESIKNTIHNIVNGIKGVFNFSWHLPRPKLPHISVSWSSVGGIVNIPHFGISWYKKAYENPFLFSSPTVVGNRGFGDGQGSEIVYGHEQLLKDIATAAGNTTINVYASEGMNVNQLADAVQARLALVQRQRMAANA